MAPEDDSTTPAAAQADDTAADQSTDSRTASEESETESGDTDWKSQARKWEREAKKASTAAAKAAAEAEAMREANQTEAEKALAAARREGQKEAEKEWKAKYETERLRGEALRVMNGRVTDPRLAFPHLSLDGVIDDEGQVDSKALTKAIDALIEEYPALAANGASGHHMDLGPKRTAKAPQNMNDLLRQAAGRS